MTKSVYTPEVTQSLVAEYSAAESVEARQEVVERFAETLEVKPASVRAKLVREGVYQKVERERKSVATKSELVAKVAEALGAPEEALESLEKATKGALTRVLAGLTKAS